MSKIINKNKRANSRLDFKSIDIFTKSKRSQVTIFIILALILVVSIALIYVVIRKPTISISPEDNPQAYIEKCARDYVKEALDILMPQGSYIEPRNYKLYKDVKVGYLCYTREFYETCKNQEPMLIEHIEKEVIGYIEPRMQNCFSNLRRELEKKNYDIDMQSMNISVEIKPEKVFITINRKLQLIKNEQTRNYETFKAQILSPIYELSVIALKIMNGESVGCGYDYVNEMMLYSNYDIKKFVTGDSTKIYTLKDKISQQELKFAIRSCVVPPGL